MCFLHLQLSLPAAPYSTVMSSASVLSRDWDLIMPFTLVIVDSHSNTSVSLSTSI